MEFRILGPLEVSAADGPLLPPGRPKQRALLAILLAHANEVVSSDGLIEELWGGQPPETAPKTLQMHVSGLRKLLERSPGASPHRILITRPPGYLIRVEPEQLDLWRFERIRAEAREAVRGGDAAAAASGLREALALWRGAPLADLAYEPFAQTEIARLEELRLAALEERIEADLELGRHAGIVGELEALVLKHPVREGLRGHLMLALYRSGRQAEALEAYQEARRTLVEEFGLEPGRSLRELEHAILQQDPSLDLASVGTESADAGEAGSGIFVGREAELEDMRAGLNAAVAGRGRLFLLVGE